MGLIDISEELKGSLLIFLSALMYATLPILGKFAFQTGLTPSSILLLRFLFSFVLLAFIIKLIKHDRVLAMSPLVLIQGACLTIGSIMYFYSLKYLAAGITTVLFFVYPVVVACLAVPIYKEKPKPVLLLALLLAISGIIFISISGQGVGTISIKGVILVLGACVCYACFGLIGQKTVAGTNPLSITATMSLAAVIILAALSNHNLVFLYTLSWQQILIGLTMAVVNTLLAILFFLKGVKKIGASRAALISTAEPPLCVLLAFIILGETLTLHQFMGFLLVFIGIILAVKTSNSSPEHMTQP